MYIVDSYRYVHVLKYMFSAIYVGIYVISGIAQCISNDVQQSQDCITFLRNPEIELQS